MERIATPDRPIPRAAIVYGIGVAVMLVVAVVDAVLIRNHLPPRTGAFADDLHAAVWRDWFEGKVPSVLFPLLAGASVFAASSRSSGGPERGTLALVGAGVWAAGAAIASWRVGSVSGGWFNYAPNSGVVFSADGWIAVPHVGIAVSWVGLTVTAAALASISVGAFRKGVGSSDGAAGMSRLLAASQLVVLVVGPVVIARTVWLLATSPGMWGRL